MSAWRRTKPKITAAATARTSAIKQLLCRLFNQIHLKYKHTRSRLLSLAKTNKTQSTTKTKTATATKHIIFVDIVTCVCTTLYKQVRKLLLYRIFTLFHTLFSMCCLLHCNDDEKDDTHISSSISQSQSQSKNGGLASFSRQLRCILWKNSVLFMRNKMAIMGECVFSALFALILVLLIVKIDPVERAPQLNHEQSVLTNNFKLYETNFYVYPNNEFVMSLAKRTVAYLALKPNSKSKENASNANSLADLFALFNTLANSGSEKLNVIPTNASSASELSVKQKAKLFAFVAFSPNLTSLQALSSDDNIKYSLSTTE